MKQFKLKELTIKDQGQEVPISYKEQILQALRTPLNPQGADHAEMAKVLPLIQKIMDTEPENDVLIEDDQHKTLVQYMKAARYSRTHEAIFDMVEDVANAETVKVEAVPDAVTN